MAITEEKYRREMLELLPKNAIVAEIGTYTGIFAFVIKDVCKPKELHLIDVWEPDIKKRIYYKGLELNYMKMVEYAKKNDCIKLHKGLSEDILKTFPDNYFDWTYIDADHRYEFVKKDLELCAKKVKDNGFICGHDYEPIDKKLKDWGVTKAVNEFCKKHSYRIIFLTDEEFASYILRKK